MKLEDKTIAQVKAAQAEARARRAQASRVAALQMVARACGK